MVTTQHQLERDIFESSTIEHNKRTPGKIVLTIFFALCFLVLCGFILAKWPFHEAMPNDTAFDAHKRPWHVVK